MPATETPAQDHAARLLAVGTQTCGFSVTATEEIPELDATAYVLHHAASGARLLYLACEDENKAFAIGFKTPPTASTGVFHILEHSVLCGSAKFPLKEPFVDLIKSSMQTFLNAMTYPDKTIYPVATTNEQDLLNLMDVYMDAVLNPAIYTKPTIFEQEGWHLELDLPEGVDGDENATPDAAGADAAAPAARRAGRLRYNGVVFNEMKGALSDPSDVLDSAVNAALFPDTPYAVISGGHPRVIPTLTYEEFLRTHARHYNLANSYIVLYGDMQVERELAFLDKNYLGDAARTAALTAKEQALAGSPAAALLHEPGAPNPLPKQAPTDAGYRRIEMATTPENAQVGLAYVLCDAQDRTRLVAADVLFEALFGTNEAPVKKAVLAAGLGGDVETYTSAACQQPYELIILQGAEPDAAEAFRRVVEDACRGLVEGGIPRDRLEAVLSGNEYDLRQRDYGTADGVVLACEALATWLYEDTDAAATRALKYGPVYEELRAALDSRYFEELLRELVLENPHRALVELVPVEGAGAADAGVADAGADEAADEAAGVAADLDPDDPGEAAELAACQAAMSDAELAAVTERVAALRAQQEAEDTPQAKATLPRLHVSDIGPARPEPPLTIDTTTPLPCLKHHIPTRQLAYAIYYFDLSCVAFDELPYVSLLAKLLKRLDTSSHTVAELDSYIGRNLGFLSVSTSVKTKPDWRLAQPQLVVAAGALSEKLPALAAIPHELWSQTIFEDTERMRDVLQQLRIAQEQNFLMAGHSAALSRALSYVSPAGVVDEQLGGVDFYLFVRELLEHFDERKDALCAKLRELQQRIFCSDGTFVSFTGSDEDCAQFWEAAGALGLEPRAAAPKELVVPAPTARCEGFAIPSDICFAAKVADPRQLGIQTSGAWSVAATALSYDYLWNEIRVKGGAYGCGFRVAHERQLAFYTYRDPGIDASLARMGRAGAWLGAFEPDADGFEGYIVSCVSSQDAPIKPYALARRQDIEYFTERPAKWRERLRDEMLAATPEAVRALGAEVTRVAEEAPLCVFGGRQLIEHSHAGLTLVDLLA